MPLFESLPNDRVHIHLLPLGGIVTGADDWQLLDADEKARAQRFRFEADRQLFVRAHGLLRRVLTLYGRGAAADWRFRLGPAGKPALCPEHHPDQGQLCFNLSHCRGMVAVAVAWRRALGVDVEALASLGEVDALAETILAPSERRQFQACDSAQRPGVLLERWTLKEAVLKAMGSGLGEIAPDAIAFDRDAGGQWQLLQDFAGGARQDWWFFSHWLDGSYGPIHLALAMARLADDADRVPEIVIHLES